MAKVKLPATMLFRALRLPAYTRQMEKTVVRYIMEGSTDGAALLAEIRPGYLWLPDDVEKANNYLFINN
jgi:hypothetical protein